MRQEIKKIQKEYGITSIYVTHDQEEAMSISDRIAVMKDGIIQQVGSPGEIYSQPNNCFVADFMGIANIVEIPDMVLEQKHYEIPFLGSSVQIDLSDKALTSNSGLNIVFRPEEVQIDDNGKFEGTVTWFENLGSLQRITMIVQGRTIIAQQLHDHQNPRIYSPEEKIRFHIKLSARNMIKN
jgi:ABC-type sugar transport system ATPase subunit